MALSRSRRSQLFADQRQQWSGRQPVTSRPELSFLSALRAAVSATAGNRDLKSRPRVRNEWLKLAGALIHPLKRAMRSAEKPTQRKCDSKGRVRFVLDGAANDIFNRGRGLSYAFGRTARSIFGLPV